MNILPSNTFYSRSGESVSQTWTSTYFAGERYTDKPIYILTSSETFSAAEEFTYNLKNLKRAIVIGEVTKGGANPGAVHQLTNHFNVFIPHGQVINPITGINWEVKGVSPDIVTNSKEAYDVAYEHVLNHVIDHYKDNAQYNFLLGEARDQLRYLKK